MWLLFLEWQKVKNQNGACFWMNETESVITSFAEDVSTAVSRVSELWLYPATMYQKGAWKIVDNESFFKMPTKWRAFLCNATNFQLFEKSFEKTYKNRCFKSHPLRDIFSRASWQLNDRPKVIRLCDDMSEATPRWDSGAGTISGETAKKRLLICS